MPFAAAISTASDTTQAAEEAIRSALSQLGQTPTLSIAFFSPHHAANAAELGIVMENLLGGSITLGVLGESVVGGSREVEDRPAISIWLATFAEEVILDPFHLDMEETPDGPSLFGWPDAILEADASKSLVLCFGDPYTFPVADVLLPRTNEDYPGLPLVGGMASSPMGPNTPSLILNGEVKEQGAVGVLIQGARFRTVVSQGCRPVGQPLVITKGQDNVINELGGQSPLDYLRGLLEQVSPHDHGLMQKGLLIGLAISEYRDQFRRGEFLIRNLIGLDPRTGALAVTDRVRRGQTVQFHVRDAATAHEDMTELLRPMKDEGFSPSAGLLFTCNGRGTRMFSVPDHDAKILQSEAGPLPLAGFFAAGELGPIGGKNFIHGFTASAVFFE